LNTNREIYSRLSMIPMIRLKNLKKPIPVPDKTNKWELKALLILNCLLLYNVKTICVIEEKSYTSH
jgi:hypothetical protein